MVSEVRKPLLIVCAHHDSWCDRASLCRCFARRLEVIPHSDHFFSRGLTEVGKTVAGWLRDGDPFGLDADPE